MLCASSSSVSPIARIAGIAAKMLKPLSENGTTFGLNSSGEAVLRIAFVLLACAEPFHKGDGFRER